MDDAVAMGIVQRVGNFAGDAQSVVERELPFARQALPKRLAQHVRHYEVEESDPLIRVVERQDVRVREGAYNPEASDELFAVERRC
jgi:hypothetical protein